MTLTSARIRHLIVGTALATVLFTALGYAAEPVKLGAPVALTGTFADEGGKLLHGYEMCIDAVNAKGGLKVGNEIRKFELVKYDYQSDTNRATQMIQRMATVDKVDFLVAPYNSGATKVTATAAERADIPMMSTAAATPSVFDQHFRKSLWHPVSERIHLQFGGRLLQEERARSEDGRDRRDELAFPQGDRRQSEDVGREGKSPGGLQRALFARRSRFL